MSLGWLVGGRRGHSWLQIIGDEPVEEERDVCGPGARDDGGFVGERKVGWLACLPGR